MVILGVTRSSCVKSGSNCGGENLEDGLDKIHLTDDT